MSCRNVFRFTRANRGLTLVEIIACLLLISLGVVAVIGLLRYGLALAQRAQAEATALQTARTFLADPYPIGLTDRSVVGQTVSGYLNGYYLKRSVVDEPGLAAGGVAPTMRVVTVTCQAFLGNEGEAVAHVHERQLVCVTP